MLSVIHAECHLCFVSNKVLVFGVITLNAVIYAECHYAESRVAQQSF
jgi:hypothetical protein